MTTTLRAITLVRQDTALTELHDFRKGAWYIRWLGFKTIFADRNRAKRLNELPQPHHYQTDDPIYWLQQSWDELTRKERGEITYVGLQEIGYHRDALEGSIQLAVWWAWKYRYFLDTDKAGASQSLDDLADKFRVWVIDTYAGVETGRQTLYHLINTILNLAWLKAEGIPGAPQNIEEEVFLDLSTYDRWRRMVAVLNMLREEALRALPGSKRMRQIREEAEEKVAAVNDPDLHQADLQRVGRKGPPRIPYVQAVINPPDPKTGLSDVTMQCDPRQLRALSKAPNVEVKLSGETYKQDPLIPVQVRRLVHWETGEALWAIRPQLNGRFTQCWCMVDDEPELKEPYMVYDDPQLRIWVGWFQMKLSTLEDGEYVRL